jgi:hypothetical protein
VGVLFDLYHKTPQPEANKIQPDWASFTKERCAILSQEMRRLYPISYDGHELSLKFMVGVDGDPNQRPS